MSHFVYSAPPRPKPTSKHAVEHALEDLRDAIISGQYHGLVDHDADVADPKSARLRMRDGHVQISEDGALYRSALHPDVNVLDYGADPTGIADSQPAFEAAMLSFTAEENVGLTLEHGYGGRVVVPYGIYRFAQPLHVNRSCIFEGVGDAQRNTTIKADPGVTAFIICGLGVPWGTLDLGTGGAAQLRHLTVTQAAKVPDWMPDHPYDVGDRVRTGTGVGEDWRRHYVCTHKGTSAPGPSVGPRSLGYDQELTVSNVVGTFEVGERINGTSYLYDGYHTKPVSGEVIGVRSGALRLSYVLNVFTAGDVVTGARSGATGTVVSSKLPFAKLKYKNLASGFQAYNGKVITGQTSGATANIQFDRNGVSPDGGNGAEAAGYLLINNVVGTFIDGEVIHDRYMGVAEVDGTVITDIPEDELDGQARWRYLGNGSCVQLYGRAGLDRVSIFAASGNGVHIEAQSPEQPNQLANANGWSMSHVNIYGSDGHGLFVNGSDTNGGYFLGGDFGANGSPDSDHGFTGTGYNIYDSSFLGNTYVQAQMASGGLGSVFSDSVGGGSTFVGCYVEGGGGGESKLGSGATILGGGLSVGNLSESSTPAVFGPGGQRGSGYLVKGMNASPYDGGARAVRYPYVGIRVEANGHVYRCTKTGKPQGVAPTSTQVGTVEVDGEVEWTCLGPVTADGYVGLGSTQAGPSSRDFLFCQSGPDVGASMGIVYADREAIFGNYRDLHCWEFGNTSLATYGMSHNRTLITDWPMRPRPAMALVDDIYIGSTRHTASAAPPSTGVPTYLADTWNPGDLVWCKAGAVARGGPVAWRCVVGGTFPGGALQATTTATSTGTAQIVLSCASQAARMRYGREVKVGDYLLIDGVTAVHILDDVHDDGVTFTTDVPVPAGTHLSIAPRPPVFEQVAGLSTGPQTIDGAKTFTDEVQAPGHRVTSYVDGSATIGNQTLNGYRGKGTIGAGQSSLTISNDRVDADSFVQAVIETDDATAVVKNVTKAAGTFTITLSAATTADTVVSFLVTN